MPKLTSILICGLSLCLVLSACGTAPAASTAMPAALPPTAVPATPAPTNEPLSVAVPAIDYLFNSGQLIVVSSRTGRVFDAFAPISLGQEYNSRFSPDGHTLAIVSDSTLYLVDLRSWKYTSTDVDLHGWATAIAYSADGGLLAVAGGRAGQEIRVVDAKSGEVRAKAEVDFSVHNVKFSTDEKAIMVYGPRANGDGMITGVPVAALLSVADLSKVWSVDLPNIRDGISPKNPRETNIFQPGASWSYTPAIAFAPEADILYIVHGDEDKLTTIDFQAHRSRTVSIHEQMSWLDQVLALTAGVAHAKGMDGTHKQGVISADGKTLYVIGTTETFTQKSSGELNMAVAYGGLQTIATKDGSLLHQLDTQAQGIELSQDGKYLYLTGWKDAPYGGAAWSEVYDPASNAILKHMDTIQLMPTRYLDGNPGLVSADAYSADSCHMASIDPASWQVSGDWQGPCVGWLPDP